MTHTRRDDLPQLGLLMARARGAEPGSVLEGRTNPEPLPLRSHEGWRAFRPATSRATEPAVPTAGRQMLAALGA